MSRFTLCLLSGALLMGMLPHAEGVKVNTLHVISEIQARFAITDVLSSMEADNQWANQEEVEYSVFLPERAFISSFSMEMDGVTTVGEIKEKDQARRDYEEARRLGTAAVHTVQALDNLPQETKKFIVKVNVPKNKRIQFNMTYQELLTREDGVYKHIINVKPTQPVDDIQVDVLIAEKSPFRLLSNGQKTHVPRFQNDIGYKTNAQLMRQQAATDVEIRSTEGQQGSLAYIYYKPQTTRRLNGQLVVLFDIERGANGGTIQTYDGYFLQTIAPENIPVGNKNVVFVIDKSGSMKGRKIAQVKKAMETILDDLHATDNFGVILFSADTQAWTEALVPARPANIRQAKNFIQQSEAKGGTNMYDSIKHALDLLKKAEQSTGSNPLASMVIFLTDGKPTVGKKNRNDIVSSIITDNRENQWSQETKYAIHCIGFGDNADMPLMQDIASANSGVARRVTADADADIQLKGVFGQFSSPILRQIEVRYIDGNVNVGSLVQPGQQNDEVLYEGSELVYVGKVDSNQRGKRASGTVTAEVKAQGKRGNIKMTQTAFESECYPTPDFTRKDGSAPAAPKYLVLCENNAPANRNEGPKQAPVTQRVTPRRPAPTPAPTPKPAPAATESPLCRIFGGTWCNTGTSNAFGDLGSRFGSRFGSFGGRGKRQTDGDGPQTTVNRNIPGLNTIGGFIERTWAYLTIKKYTKESKEGFRPAAERRTKEQQAIALSKKYQFVSEYTSLILVHGRGPSRQQQELEDVPNVSRPGQAPADDSAVGSADAAKQQVNFVQPDGKCNAGIILVLDSRAASDLRARRGKLRTLVSKIVAEKDFDSVEFTIVEMFAGGQFKTYKLQLSGNNQAAINAAIDAAIASRGCGSCRVGFADLVPYLIGPKGRDFHKSFIVFTGENDSLGTFARSMAAFAMPKVVVPAHNAEFSATKKAELASMTSDNQVLYSINLDDIVDLVKC